MTREEVFDYCRQQYKTEPDYPWKDYNAVLRHSDNNKWYGFLLLYKRLDNGAFSWPRSAEENHPLSFTASQKQQKRIT